MTSSAGHGLALAIFPLAAAIIAAVFAGMLLRRFLTRRRLYEAMWSVSMIMYAAASFAAFLGVAYGWDTVAYRVYWLLGAILNVPFLAQGEVYLLGRNSVLAHVALVGLLAATGLSFGVMLTADVHLPALAKTLPLGKEALGDASVGYQLRWLSWIGYAVLLAGCVWSALSMRGRPELRDRTAGTVWIALGATIVAVGSGVGAGFGIVPVFAIGLAAGIVVMFWGFLRAGGASGSRRPSDPVKG